MSQRQSKARRRIRLENVGQLADEVEQLLESAMANRLESHGNWTLAQTLQYLGKNIEFSFDGFPFRYPWHLRLACRLLSLVSWRLMIAVAFPVHQNRCSTTALEPQPAVMLAESLVYFRRQLDRIRQGERMRARSPTGGKLTSPQWEHIHLRHAKLHLSLHWPGDNLV